jgi:hypothetical protein
MAVSPPPGPISAATPCRLRRLIRPPFWRAAARGLLAVLMVTAIVVPLACLAWTMLAIFFAITVGLNLGLWAGRDSGLASLAGAILMPLVGLVIPLLSDVQTIGPTSGPIALADIGGFSYAARFRFTDARVATEFIGVDEARRLGGLLATGAWRAAPIVPSNWTPAEPVHAWAIGIVTHGYGPADFRSPRNWQQSYRAGIRYVDTAFAPAHDAVARAIARYGLTTTPNAPLLYWVDEPHAVIAGERTFIAWVMFGGVATWLLFLVGEALLVPATAPPDARPPGTLAQAG